MKQCAILILLSASVVASASGPPQATLSAWAPPPQATVACAEGKCDCKDCDCDPCLCGLRTFNCPSDCECKYCKLKKRATYGECYNKSIKTGKPLVVWVRMACLPCERKTPDYVHYHCDSFGGSTKPRVIVATPQGEDLVVRGTLTGAMSADRIQGLVPVKRSAPIRYQRGSYVVLRSFTPIYYERTAPAFFGQYANCPT